MLNGIRPGSRPFAEIAPYIRSADVAFANLEVPLTNRKTPTSKKSAAELKAKQQFVLKADPAHVAHLANVGFDLFSLANNHAMDYGGGAINDMRCALQAAGMNSTGAGLDGDSAAHLSIYKTKSGLRVGLLSALAFVGRPALRKCSPAGPARPGVNVLAFDGRIDETAVAKLKSWVGGARSRCDFLVVALHWGIERQTKPTAYQRTLGHAVVDAGADLVWGHHPHVLQPIETYKGVPILYSAGNLISPLPGRTALFQVSIQGHKTLKVASIPAIIRGGKVAIERNAARSVPASRILTNKALSIGRRRPRGSATVR